jgi:3-amino-4-hydroxybenzoic acid synthase
VLIARDGTPEELGNADVVIVDDPAHEPAGAPVQVEVGRFVEVRDADTLEAACESARTRPWTVLRFRDATRIPLEIVLAAADEAKTNVITVVEDAQDAAIVVNVLERGSDGVLLAPAGLGEVAELMAAVGPHPDDLELVELEVTGTRSVGVGERACVDTCTYLRQDEGILVGSRSRGLMLCASETHPLPYMPTRPFRVNAGAIMSYTLGGAQRTQYLSELGAGSTVLAVDAKGRTRPVTVGRTKIETRPLRSIDAVAPDGRPVNLIVQDDWHVRLVGPGGAVLNSTELRPGDRVLGYLPSKHRHVGYPIDELCYEQ